MQILLKHLSARCIPSVPGLALQARRFHRSMGDIDDGLRIDEEKVVE